jgi:hypothetical protein
MGSLPVLMLLAVCVGGIGHVFISRRLLGISAGEWAEQRRSMREATAASSPARTVTATPAPTASKLTTRSARPEIEHLTAHTPAAFRESVQMPTVRYRIGLAARTYSTTTTDQRSSRGCRFPRSIPLGSRQYTRVKEVTQARGLRWRRVVPGVAKV